jgi:hypothetical protein
MAQICSSYLGEELDFVARCLDITSSRFDYFESGVAVLTGENYCDDEDSIETLKYELSVLDQPHG